MNNKKLKKYLIVSLGALSSLSSNGVIMASTDYIQSQVMNPYPNPQYMNQMPSYIPTSPQFNNNNYLPPNNQIKTPVSSNGTTESTKNNSEKDTKNNSLPAKIINNKPTKTPSGLPSASIARIQPTPSSNGVGFGTVLGLLGIGGVIGCAGHWAWNTIMSKPNWEDSIIWQRVCIAHNYHKNFAELDDTLIIETPEDVKTWLSESDADLLNHFASSDNQAALSLFNTIKKLYNEILNSDGFKKLNFNDDTELGLSKENKRKKAALESAMNHLANPLDEYLEAIDNNEAEWRYLEKDLSDDMTDGQHEISDEISDNDGNNFKYSAIINKNGNNICLESFTEVEE